MKKLYGPMRGSRRTISPRPKSKNASPFFGLPCHRGRRDCSNFGGRSFTPPIRDFRSRPSASSSCPTLTAVLAIKSFSSSFSSPSPSLKSTTTSSVISPAFLNFLVAFRDVVGFGIASEFPGVDSELREVESEFRELGLEFREVVGIGTTAAYTSEGNGFAPPPPRPHALG